MRISLNWLRELVPFNATAEQLAETLTLSGFEVESIEDLRALADGVVVGKVLDRQQHPNADRLSVCTVDVGQAEPLTIVCGAKNVATGQTVAVATVGTYLPAVDLKLKPTKLRGVPSAGMICSLSELGLAKESEGIHVFAEGESLAAGMDVRPLLGLDDVILDVTSTANRADALSMVGIAREVAALVGGAVTLPPTTATLPDRLGSGVTVRVSESKACPTYVGTVIEGVTIGPSPDWLQRRLQSAGVRPISNVVDVTNWVMLEWGQPLHAFDRDRLQGVCGGSELAIGVRYGRAGETLKTLDGQERSLSPQALLITGNDRPIALAGVMGGEETEVDSSTTNLLLEAALFEPAAVRRSARSIGIRTEASTRYERGTNQVEFGLALQRAIDLILQLAGGQVVARDQADARPPLETFSRTLNLRLDRLHQILGPLQPPEGEKVDEASDLRDFVPAEAVEQILSSLGCQLRVTTAGTPEGGGREWEVIVPPYRYRDLEREIDLIEEVARLFGYNRFSSTLPPKSEFGCLPPDIALLRQIRELFRAEGLTELMHYSLCKPAGGRQVTLANPLYAEYSALRTELISGLVDAYQYNLEQGNGGLNGFEIGRVFWSEEDGLFEADKLGGILGGDARRGRWTAGGKESPLTWYEAKGILEAVFDRLNLSVEYQADRADARLHPGRTASLWLRGNRLGTFGQLHPELCQARDLPAEIYVFELDLETIYKVAIDDAPPQPKFAPYATLPASSRDLAFFAPTKVTVAELERTMAKAGRPLLEQVELFDEYRGDRVPEGQRSLAFRLLYRSPDRTLTDEDVEPLHQKVRDAITEKFGATLRS
ncbi:phenylalanine--tRNA ligase subunit beta [Limnothrix sp. FACHB-708]|uniref:phenylalanine--tRNA ligase subunit beta n=1 Tax=unclassified Limnothrix TaxID=2632864 RepID=UPI001685EC61|nr:MULTISPECIES: phenylalanine--tRNA ligase subunit beta [unclassified Limnothrix]MBD2554360.1 phenylalanine--tRNA ligase subunit beta [Limnothrix sp. FACHB-708]MBD2591500.1 phenylalanine--tRNA ligase subunit beta [Limnothrix sp. FACHB-406]